MGKVLDVSLQPGHWSWGCPGLGQGPGKVWAMVGEVLLDVLLSIQNLTQIELL